YEPPHGADICHFAPGCQKHAAFAVDAIHYPFAGGFSCVCGVAHRLCRRCSCDCTARWPAPGNVSFRGGGLLLHLLHSFIFRQTHASNSKWITIMIEINNISKWYGHFQVLNQCSTTVNKGEVVVVCGPSGSGKST